MTARAVRTEDDAADVDDVVTVADVAPVGEALEERRREYVAVHASSAGSVLWAAQHGVIDLERAVVTAHRLLTMALAELNRGKDN